MRVLKFGGKSLSSKEKCYNICKYISKIYKNDKKIIVIVSAIGNTTDELMNQSHQYLNTINCNSSNALTLCHEKFNNQFINAEIAKLISTGENQSASLMAIMLISMGLKAKSLSSKDVEISTYGDYLNSKISYINKSKINEILNSETIAIITGFQGINSHGEITTLGRGGSDTTAVAIASIYGVSAEIYSDYNGIFAGDPKYNNFKKINQLNYNSIISMAESGAKVLDKRAAQIAKNSNTTIISKSSSQPNLKGTIINQIENDIISICEISNLCKISIIVSNYLKLTNTANIVLKVLNNYKFYNFTCNNDKISFYIEEKNKIIIYNLLSKKLNILTKRKS